MGYTTDNGARPGIYSGVAGKVAQLIDGVLSPIAPRLALRRRAARAEMLAYDMASRTKNRRPQQAGSADQDLLQDLPTMRRNARAMVRDDAGASAMVRVLVENVVGTGLRPQMMVAGDVAGMNDAAADRWNRDVEALFDAASEQIDAGEGENFVSLQAQVLRTRIVDGEFLLHRTFIDDPSRVVGTAFESIDVDRLDDPPALSQGVEIRSGVEVGPRQNPVAYWIRPRHPDDSNLRWSTDRLRRNEAERHARHGPGGHLQVLHGFERQRPGQTRGAPMFAASFGLVEATNDMVETELQAARAAGKFCAFIKQTLDPYAAAGVSPDSDGKGGYYERLESATIRYLGPGEDLVPYTPNRPGNNFDPFVVRMLRQIAASVGLPYEMVAKDFGGMNYSSARVALLEARRGFEVLQQELVRQFCAPVFEAVIMDAVLHGKLAAPPGFAADPRRFLRVHWQPPAWGWVDPVKEIEASRLAIENSLSTPQAESARQGGDAEANLEQRARFLKRAGEVEKRYGLQPGALTSSAPPNGAAAPPAAGGKDSDTADDQAADEASDE